MLPHWAGHFSRLGDHCTPKVKLYGEILSGYRHTGAPRNRYRLPEECTAHALVLPYCRFRSNSTTAFGGYLKDVTSTTASGLLSLLIARPGSTSSTRLSSPSKTTARSTLKTVRREKDRKAWALNPGHTFTCYLCSRICLSRIGLVRHQRACSRFGPPPSQKNVCGDKRWNVKLAPGAKGTLLISWLEILNCSIRK